MDMEGSFVEIQGSFKGYTGLFQCISTALSVVLGGSLNGGLFECLDWTFLIDIPDSFKGYTGLF